MSLTQAFKKVSQLTFSKKDSDSTELDTGLDSAYGIYIDPKNLSEWVHKSPRFKIRPNAKSIARSGGQYLSNLRGRGVDFSEVRLYQAGDDIRTIDWRVTARTSKPHTKLYEEERERPVVLVVDQGPSLFFGSQFVFKSFFVAQLASLIAFHAVRQGDRLGSLLFNHKKIMDLPPRRGQQSWQVFCRRLVEFNHQLNPAVLTEPTIAWPKIATNLAHIVRPGSLVILISDFSTSFGETDAALGKLRAHNDLIAIHVSDPMEKRLPAQYARYTNGKETFFVNGQNKNTRFKFEEHYESQLDKLAILCRKYSSPLIQMSTADNPYDIARYLDSRPGK